jgi:hypothetical protein
VDRGGDCTVPVAEARRTHGVKTTTRRPFKSIRVVLMMALVEVRVGGIRRAA